MKTRSILVLALLAGCGGPPRIPDKVLDVESAKLDPAASARLGTARQELETSRAEAARASDRIAEARQEEQLAEADQKKVEVELERAKKALADAEARKKAAEARREYAAKLVESRVAAEDAAKARAELADANLELAKVDAVQLVNAQAGGQYKRGDFTDRVAGSQRDLDGAASKARKLEQEAADRQSKWQELARKAPPLQ